jgi:hypothetical protein
MSQHQKQPETSLRAKRSQTICYLKIASVVPPSQRAHLLFWGAAAAIPNPDKPEKTNSKSQNPNKF